MTVTISEAGRLLRAGGVVAFPTETVYGLGANALDAAAVGKIYALKGRPATSPLIVHVDSVEMARGLVEEWPALADELARAHWPGPLTMVLPKQARVPDIVTAGLATVGIRMPRHPVALELIREAGVPLAAPSANKFTGISPTTAAHVREAFGDAVPVIDGGACVVGIESTVVAVIGGRVTVLRPGMLEIAGETTERATGEAHPSPGMHHRHYSPRTPLVIAPAELPPGRGAYVWRVAPRSAERQVHMPEDAPAYAAKLYAVLHELDQAGLDYIAVEPLPRGDEWLALRDRLTRAAG